MSRHVSTPSNAIQLMFAHWEDHGFPDEWDEIIDRVRHMLVKQFPSFKLEDRWEGREDRAILESGHAMVGISEFVGTISIWAIPKTHLGEYWIRNTVFPVAETLLAPVFGGEVLRRIGVADNGEAWYNVVKV